MNRVFVGEWKSDYISSFLGGEKSDYSFRRRGGLVVEE